MNNITCEDDEKDIWEWFQEGKENVLKSLKRKNLLESANATSNVIKEQNRKPKRNGVNTKTNVSRLTDRALHEIYGLPQLGMFLYVMTQKEPDFFVDQISASDEMERVLLYTRILVTICELELPGFHYEILSKVAGSTELLDHFKAISIKIFSKRFKTMWTDLGRVDKIIYSIQTLVLQAQKLGLLDDQGMQLLFDIWTHLKRNENPSINERAICIQFRKQLEVLFSVEDDILSQELPPSEIYPTHDEVLNWCKEQDDKNWDWVDANNEFMYENVHKYINSQQHLLRKNFLAPLRMLVRALHEKSKQIKQTIYRNVEIKLNKHFADAYRHRLIFIDIAPAQRAEKGDNNIKLSAKYRQGLDTLKCGALMCLSTSINFENLILATVTTTDPKLLKSGFIAIVIVHQYNIGNVFNQPFIMFEAPSYFEPFEKAYNYLSHCNQLNFPMADYIVNCNTVTTMPAYLSTSQPPITYCDQKFLNKLKRLPLNDSQMSAFRNALVNNFNLIQGPPGTGKTHLSLQLLKTLIENAKSSTPIVLITYTNDSLDKFLLKLSEYTDSIVRFGCQTRLPEIAKYNARADKDMHMINPRLKRLYWMVNLEFKSQFNKLQRLYKEYDDSDSAYQNIWVAQRDVWNGQQKLNSIRTIFQHYLVLKKRVIAMTTTCASRMNFVFRFLKSKIVVFEEAAEILEAHILPCLTPFTEHVIMVGDHKQLKPFTNIYHIDGFEYGNISLFERLIRNKFDASILTIQYRMRRSFADLLSPIIYENLFSDDIVDKYPKVRNMNQDLFFVKHNKPEIVSSGSILNDYELKKVIELVRHLMEVSAYSQSDVVVLSPYSKQVERIKLNFSNIPNLSEILISTVDSYQGLEANIVVLSLVRSNKGGNIGFLKQQNRICVALSRARYGLYIIGNMDILAAKSPTWLAIHEKLKQQSAIGSEFPYQKKSENF